MIKFNESRLPTIKGMMRPIREGRCPSRALPVRICQSLTRRLGAVPRFMGNRVMNWMTLRHCGLSI